MRSPDPVVSTHTALSSKLPEYTASLAVASDMRPLCHSVGVTVLAARLDVVASFRSSALVALLGRFPPWLVTVAGTTNAPKSGLRVRSWESVRELQPMSVPTLWREISDATCHLGVPCNVSADTFASICNLFTANAIACPSLWAFPPLISSTALLSCHSAHSQVVQCAWRDALRSDSAEVLRPPAVPACPPSTCCPHATPFVRASLPHFGIRHLLSESGKLSALDHLLQRLLRVIGSRDSPVVTSRGDRAGSLLLLFYSTPAVARLLVRLLSFRSGFQPPLIPCSCITARTWHIAL